MSIDPILAALTAPGTAFEIGVRDGMRQFVNAPPDINMLIDGARRFGDAIAIVEGDTRISYADVLARRDALVPMLDIVRGDRVAIVMRNRADWMIAFLAVVRAGGVAVLLNSRSSGEELIAALDNVTPCLVLADAERAARLRDAGYAGRIMDRRDFPAAAAVLLPPPDRMADADDPCVILFTSGTTGQVKGAVLTHRNMVTGIWMPQLSGMMVLHRTAAAMNIPVPALLANMPQQAVLLIYPLFHISGLGSGFLAPFLSGGKIVIMRRWDADDAVRLMEQERITQFTGVPTMLWDLLRSPALANADMSSVRNVASGGQALPIALLNAVQAAFPHAVLGTGYGQTEVAGSIAMAIGQDFTRKPESAGRILPLADVRIVDGGGIELPVGTVGEIVTRGPMVMHGYWNAPDATAATIDTQGWLHTGDVGYVDDEGYIFIVDRLKDMVISGGENIYCAEVERVMGAMAGVDECAAFGIADDRLGELLVAVVRGTGLDAGAIHDEVATRLASYKAPAKVVFSTTALPRNALGKVDKKLLRALWPDLIKELH